MSYFLVVAELGLKLLFELYLILRDVSAAFITYFPMLWFGILYGEDHFSGHLHALVIFFGTATITNWLHKNFYTKWGVDVR